eukprot:scaffold362831_cov33-Prasinocladus_malaysianus.AAC.1
MAVMMSCNAVTCCVASSGRLQRTTPRTIHSPLRCPIARLPSSRRKHLSLASSPSDRQVGNIHGLRAFRRFRNPKPFVTRDGAHNA